MNSYHASLVELYKVTDGKDTKAVNFKDVVKKVGFLGNYPDIFQYLSREGWIAEDAKTDFVRITHWGIAEAKKAQRSATENPVKPAANPNARKCVGAAREFVTAIESFANDASKENLKKVEKKFEELENALNLAKAEAA